MTIKERIRRSVSNKKEDVFFTSDFAKFGSRRQVSQALKELEEEGFLKRFSKGMYAKTSYNSFGKCRTVRLPLASLAVRAMNRLGIKWELGQMAKRYFKGEITQIPGKEIFEIGDQNFTRVFSYGGERVYYEKNGIIQIPTEKDDAN